MKFLHRLFLLTLTISSFFTVLSGNEAYTADLDSNVQGGQSIASGELHSLFVKSDGTVWAVGSNLFGQLGDGTFENRAIPVKIDINASSVAAGAHHSLILKKDGTLWATGNEFRELGSPVSEEDRLSPKKIASDVISIAAGSYHSMFIKSDGGLWAFGRNNVGQLGDGTHTDRKQPVKIASNVLSVSAGVKPANDGWSGGHSLFVKKDGTLWAMGYNWAGALGDGTTSNRSTPVQVASGVLKAVAGGYHSLFIKNDGSLWVFGRNWYGQLGDGNSGKDKDRHTPWMLLDGEVVDIAAGGAHSLFVKSDRSLWGMGRNDYGQLGIDTTEPSDIPVLIKSNIRGVAAGGETTMFINENASLFVMGRNSDGQLGNQASFFNAIESKAVKISDDVLKVAAGDNHSLFVKNDGTLWGMGWNQFGELGDGSFSKKSSPVLIDSDVSSIFNTGGRHSLYRKKNGTLWGMGEVYYGQLGIGEHYIWKSNDEQWTGYPNTSVPIEIPLESVVQTAGANYHSLFIADDGDLWVSGENDYGQLGNGTRVGELSPIKIEEDVSEATAGGGPVYSHSLFVKNDGALWAMGSNQHGQLGDGSLTDRLSPVSITTNVKAVSTAVGHTLILKNDGVLWSVGDNQYGQLGIGSTDDQRSPVRVASSVKAIAAGGWHSLFIKNDDTLWAMGNNNGGMLDGTWSHLTRPVQIANGVKACAAGSRHSLFIKNDGSLWGIGSNEFGELGIGLQPFEANPVAVINGNGILSQAEVSESASVVNTWEVVGAEASKTIALWAEISNTGPNSLSEGSVVKFWVSGQDDPWVGDSRNARGLLGGLGMLGTETVLDRTKFCCG